MGIPVRLQVFEGPLDLLLHLIDKHKIDIYDIPIVEITKQYMDYIDAMKKANLEIMSEFLLMASTLLDIKCRMLLPKEVNEEGEEEDPRRELVEQLLEYKMYKQMSFELLQRQTQGERAFFRKVPLPEEIAAYIEPVDLEQLMADFPLAQMNKVFYEVLRRKAMKVDPVRSGFGRLEKEEVTVQEKTQYVAGLLKQKKRMNFYDLLEKEVSKVHLVVTFLAVLELIKEGVIRAVQERKFGEIIIEAI